MEKGEERKGAGREEKEKGEATLQPHPAARCGGPEKKKNNNKNINK